MISYKSGGYITRLLCLGTLDINIHYCLFLNKGRKFYIKYFLQKVNQKASKYVRWWDMLINLVGRTPFPNVCVCVYIHMYICTITLYTSAILQFYLSIDIKKKKWTELPNWATNSVIFSKNTNTQILMYI